VRWWLAQGAHTDETIRSEIRMIHDSGFAGIELCLLNEPNVDSSIYAYGSEEWAHDVQTAIRMATGLGMSVSLTSGTHWATANVPGLDPDSQAALQEVGYSSERVPARATRTGALKPPAGPGGARSLIGVYAYRVPGEVREVESSDLFRPPTFHMGADLVADSVVDLTDSVADGGLTWTAPADGEYVLFGFWQQGAHDSASPSVEASYCINYFDRRGVEALAEYLSTRVLDDPGLVHTIREGDVQMFMDSLELNSSQHDFMFWSEGMADEFLARKGYDVRPYLPLFIGTSHLWSIHVPDHGHFDLAGEEGRELRARIRNDLYDLHTQLLMENMMLPLKEWLNAEYGIRLRAQISYGTYMEISEPALAVDFPEIETRNQRDQLDIYRLWTGAAKLTGATLSSETGAHSNMNYAFSLQEYLQANYVQYAAGVSRVIWHGWASRYGPYASVAWPGYEAGMRTIAGRFSDREPAFDDYPELNDHHARIQRLLREGISQTDLGILYLRYGEPMPYDDPEATWLLDHVGYIWEDVSLQDAGYSYDYFSPRYLDRVEYSAEEGVLAAGAVGYQAILLFQEALPLDGARRLLEMARDGLKVVVVEGAASRSPFNDGADEELAGVMAELKRLPDVVEVASQADVLEALAGMDVAPRAAFVEPNAQLLTQVRRDGEDVYLYVYNYSDGTYSGLDHGTNVRTQVVLEGSFEPYSIDSWTGEVSKVALYRHEGGMTYLPIDLDYGDVALYALEAVEGEPLHVVRSDASEVFARDGRFVVRETASGTYTTVLSDGTRHTSTLAVPEAVELGDWTLTVEDWRDSGVFVWRSETRNGNTTAEGTYVTSRDMSTYELETLDTWDDVEGIGRSVSGIGYYRTSFAWDPRTAHGAYLDLGRLVQTATVFVNGVETDPANLNRPVVDASGLLVEGENRLDVRVTTTLTNRQLANGYKPEGRVGDHREHVWKYFEYGLASATLVPFAEDVLAASPGARAAAPEGERAVVPVPEALRADARPVPQAELERIYEEVRTPYKYGIVLRPESEDEYVDCPNVFRLGDAWYMVYVVTRKEVGYETRLARSEDLLHWTTLGTVLPFREDGWDRWQADASVALFDPAWGGSAELQTWDGRYWFSYFGGDEQGYETDPLSIGIAWSRAPDEPTPWTRLEENPVLSPGQPDARPFERATLYKSYVLWDRARSLGYPFVMFYNAKQEGPWVERIGMAVSEDMVRWSRFGDGPVIDNGSGISGDPQVVRIGELWVMFYFGAGWQPKAFDTFAASYDLVHWTKWTGPPLKAPSEPWDETYAHKPWLVKHDGVVYHFYCAVGSEGRVIAVGTSRDLRVSR
jgi:predicted GH43/DUF377 family glycosyl hydrolase